MLYTHRTLYRSSSFAIWCSWIGRQPPALVGSKLGWMDKMAEQMMVVWAPKQIAWKSFEVTTIWMKRDIYMTSA